MITSSGNQQIKHILQLNRKAKTRYGQRVFVAEGVKMCMEAPREMIQAMYVSEAFMADNRQSQMLKDYSYEVVKDALFKTISDTQTPQGILALVKMPAYTLEELLGNGKTPPHLLILESIQDPGNLGTMMRTGEGAGITGIIMNKSTVDLFNPKTIRSTMGSLYRVPFYIAEDLHQVIRELKEKGIRLFAAHLEGAVPYDKPDYTGPCGFFIGNEGNGLKSETAGMADAYIKIPMEGKVESLNAAVAASLLMYEVNRQRR